MRFLSLGVMAVGATLVAASAETSLDQQVQRNRAPLVVTKGVVLSYADVVEKVRDSVVTIEVLMRRDPSEEKKAAQADEIFDLQPPAREAKDDEDKDENQADGNGSGIVLTKQGLILTNNHVVEHAEIVRVRPRGVEAAFLATIVGRDPYTDVALLRVEGYADWSPATLGDSSLVRVGDVALALGSPLGLDQTLTSGVISATGRSHLGVMASGMEDFIQTDAAINPGNSGGPLMDALGRVVAINTAKYWGENIGFSVPINLALKIATDLEANGRVVRGFLGARVVPLTKSLGKAMGLRPGIKGVVVDEVQAGAPGALAGLLPEDIVVQVNQMRIDSRPRFYLAMAMLRPLDEAHFEVMRKGLLATLTVRLGVPPELAKNNQPATHMLVPGLELADLDERLRNRFAMPVETEGIVVVKDFGSKDGAPLLKAGEIVISVNGEEMLLLTDLPDPKASQGRPLMLRIRDKNGVRMVSVPTR